MISPSLAIFSNFFIDNEERLQRMKDSFYSFKDINPKEWVINIRGSLKYDAGNFLKSELNENLNLSYVEGGSGWIQDSLKISRQISSDYVFFWIEDHIMIASPDELKNCILEMKEFNIDQLWYSFLIDKVKTNFSLVNPYKIGKHITVVKYDFQNCSKITKVVGDFYTISCVSIMNKNFFLKILSSNKPFLKRFHRKLPFDFEKLSSDKVTPIILHSLPNSELFVSIDDDLCQPGYSLISRGLYPDRISRDNMKVLEFGYFEKIKIKIKKIIPLKIIQLILWPFKFFRRLFYTLNFLINNR
ncbi:MAG: hypothetical protein CMF96_10670 [Candidatus Marinimicrobia bacterium]|nr:hypothetical protein [Candidatus Neomarinimicrobiota bacterium]|tara:strand:- start:319 stop:1221 length:903 start_codon:yes stop_codon:yes gene_type:complete